MVPNQHKRSRIERAASIRAVFLEARLSLSASWVRQTAPPRPPPSPSHTFYYPRPPPCRPGRSCRGYSQPRSQQALCRVPFLNHMVSVDERFWQLTPQRSYHQNLHTQEATETDPIGRSIARQQPHTPAAPSKQASNAEHHGKRAKMPCKQTQDDDACQCLTLPTDDPQSSQGVGVGGRRAGRPRRPRRNSSSKLAQRQARWACGRASAARKRPPAGCSGCVCMYV